MATLTIRDLDDAVKAKLKVRAAKHGRSMESEVRSILAAAVSGGRPPTGLGSFIRSSFDEVGGVELDLPTRKDSTPRRSCLIVVDTTVLSEVILPAPSVLQWLDDQASDDIIATAITAAELRAGVR